MVTNPELFEMHRVFIEGAFMAMLHAGADIEELVAVMVDRKDTRLPEAVRDAFDLEGTDAIDMPLPGGTKAAMEVLSLGVLDRESMIDLLTEIEPDIAHSLGKATRLSRAPCVILAGGSATLHHLAIPALIWVPGGDA